ncbi:MAG: RNA-binding protein [Desulfuromonadales bacterium]|nr:RNA-binding protein [Desulfuromonadales bacterium]
MKRNTAYRDIFVSDLPYEIGMEEIKQLFALCGSVQSVQLVTDSNGEFKGLAFVRMANAKETQEAINTLDGTYLSGRYIKVSEARSKEERSGEIAVQPLKTRRRRSVPGRKKVR